MCFAALILNTVDCNAQPKPWTLRGCMRYLNKTIDDTVKYDFKVSPYHYCNHKHGFGLGFRNRMGLWELNPLTLHFRLRGVKHPDDMSSIVNRSFYRYLNDEPIKFRKQKKNYKTYWIETAKGRDFSEMHNEIWGKYETPDSIMKREYLEFFHLGRRVRGYFCCIKQISESSSQGEYIEYIGEVVKIENDKPTIKIISTNKMPEGFTMADFVFDKIPEVGEIKNIEACSVYLIPDE